MPASSPGRGDQRGGELATLGPRQVDRDRPLPLVEPGPVEADAFVGDRPALVVEAAADGVEADHVGAELREREPPERRGNERGTFDDPQALQQPHRRSDSRVRACVTPSLRWACAQELNIVRWTREPTQGDPDGSYVAGRADQVRHPLRHGDPRRRRIRDVFEGHGSCPSSWGSVTGFEQGGARPARWSVNA